MSLSPQKSLQKPLKSLCHLALRCLTEYANVRPSLFSNEAAKSLFVSTFVCGLAESMVIFSSPGPVGQEIEGMGQASSPGDALAAL